MPTEHISSIHVLAVKAGQNEVSAPGHATWDKFKCEHCDAEFYVGPPRWLAVFEKVQDYVKTLQEFLAEEHKQKAPHQNAYDLGA